jgi:hypothetical protein
MADGGPIRVKKTSCYWRLPAVRVAVSGMEHGPPLEPRYGRVADPHWMLSARASPASRRAMAGDR